MMLGTVRADLDYLWLTKGDLPGEEEEKALMTGIRNIAGV